MKLQVEPVIDDAKRGIRDFKQTIKEIGISAVIMIVAWIILGILNYIGVESKFLYPLNFLTASLNGMQGNGILGIIGGIIAKLILLTMIVQTVIPIYKENFGKNKKKADVKGLIDKFIELLRAVFKHGMRLAGFILLGIGVALLIYAFLTVNGNFQNSFVIVLALISTLRILLSQTSTVIRFFTTLFRLTPISNLPIYSVFLGLSFGFTISISMAVIFKSAILAYIIGFSLCFVGYLMVMMQRKKKMKV